MPGLKGGIDITVSPNPVNGILKISGLEKNAEKIEVISLTGSSVRTVQNTSQVDMTGVAKGTYLVKVTTSEGVTTQKVIKK